MAYSKSPPSDDITQISQCLDTLTTSVGQLLALQTQKTLGHRPVLPTLPYPSHNKRHSITGGLMRQESSGVIDIQGGEWPGDVPRDVGLMPVSKWEQLNLAPDLLRSLSKFGIPSQIDERSWRGTLSAAIKVNLIGTREKVAYPGCTAQIGLYHESSHTVEKAETMNVHVGRLPPSVEVINDVFGRSHASESHIIAEVTYILALKECLHLQRVAITYKVTELAHDREDSICDAVSRCLPSPTSPQAAIITVEGWCRDKLAAQLMKNLSELVMRSTLSSEIIHQAESWPHQALRAI
ncbi:hypothetical protein BJ138DRAFT_1188734 [Hygrophoropsis aurantiaca]|uniref:Uncharacterized protein n=1 Tax=Hygrophoropsis aurantiaca TaxID=72124 RepID=A0ACB7ZT72_9AGAM|nr:hypothetical protein BJ138DRAFT_1188734 [Hygrophoropsis aurantiaca]